MKLRRHPADHGWPGAVHHECGTPASLWILPRRHLTSSGLRRRSAPGHSLHSLAASPNNPDRTVFAEYHDGGSSTGAFMVRWHNWKYIHYSGLPPQLFDLETDPDELVDLGTNKAQRAIEARREGARRLAEICDADAVNARCFADQAKRIEDLGGIDACRNAYLFNHTPTPAEQDAMETMDG